MTRVFLHSEAGYAQQVRARDHELRADEPVADGGRDSGPAPYELLLSGLGACTAITLRMYADRKGWDLGATDVMLHFRRDADGNEFIDREIACSATLTPEQLAKLAEIAEKTPVTKTVRRGTPISTKFV